MSKKEFSRRDFLRCNSVTGLGLLLPGSLSAAPLHTTSLSTITPALLGGKPVFDKEWPQWPQWIPEQDEQRVIDVLRSGVWSRKNVVTEFENKWAATVGANRCLAVVNGTNALVVSLIENNIGAGDEVLIATYTFIATPVSVLTVGAMPVFVDTDPETFQIDVSKIEQKITPRTKAIMPVHLAGLPADMDAIMKIAAKHKLIVIEDACQAHLAEYNNKKVGTIGHAGCFSFQNSKNLPIGEGGAIVSDDEAFIDRCFAYHNFGNGFGSVKPRKNESGVLIRGNKLRLTEYQAAIGLSQIKRLEEQTKRRTESADLLRSELPKIPGIIPVKLEKGVTRGAYHLFPFRYKKEEFNDIPRSRFIDALNAEGVTCYGGYEPLNTMPYLEDTFKSKNFIRSYSKETLDITKYRQRNMCPENDKLCQEAVWLPQYVLLADKPEITKIIEAIHKIYVNAKKLNQ
ncbi:MAG: DegT/DnrJ/EryC1/StrS family aminotransferase [Bacteroidetes bacterium]|nr:DegT/DnrJ/EryC1/StrS family aminotransferase [Bacteroidota bacterium]